MTHIFLLSVNFSANFIKKLKSYTHLKIAVPSLVEKKIMHTALKKTYGRSCPLETLITFRDYHGLTSGFQQVVPYTLKVLHFVHEENRSTTAPPRAENVKVTRFPIHFVDFLHTNFKQFVGGVPVNQIASNFGRVFLGHQKAIPEGST